MRSWLSPLLLLVGCLPAQGDVREELLDPELDEALHGASAETPVWPATAVDLLIPPAPQVDRTIKVFLDPGHGTGTNTGNQGSRCQAEEDAMLELADDLAARLPHFGPFEVKSARPDGARVGYGTRVRRANAWDADVFLSLHSDARGLMKWWKPLGSWSCTRTDADPGFAILVSEEGGPRLAADRSELAGAVAKRMAQAGFGAYSGIDYGGLYEAGDVDGTWLDRRGLLMLRRPTMPSVIIETYHAWDLREVRRWDEERTRDAFAPGGGPRGARRRRRRLRTTRTRSRAWPAWRGPCPAGPASSR